MKGEIPFASPCVVGHDITGVVVEHSSYSKPFRVRAGLREDNGSASAAVVEERERELVSQLNGSVNGRAQYNGSYSFYKVLEGGREVFEW